ncbi:MAG: NIPSNAP family protein [Telluria sp.]
MKISAAITALCLAAAAFTAPLPAAAAPCCTVVELRQYVTYPGLRDTLTQLFEERFIESQEAVGIKVVGQFRDVNDPDHFTWVRGFDGMAARKKALEDFYYGELWRANKQAANATLYDNDDVLLLRPVSPGAGFDYDPGRRPAPGVPAPAGFVVAQIYYFDHAVTPEFTGFFEHDLMPLFERHGAHVLARLVSEKSANTFERLPVREHVNAFVWFAGFPDRAAYDAWLGRLAQDLRWRTALFGQLRRSLARPPEVLMLAPTARSQLR